MMDVLVQQNLLLEYVIKYKVFYMPNPVDVSFEKLENYNNTNFNNDVFFAMSHGVHRGVLKKVNLTKEKILSIS